MLHTSTSNTHVILSKFLLIHQKYLYNVFSYRGVISVDLKYSMLSYNTYSIGPRHKNFTSITNKIYKIVILRFTLSRRRAWVQTDKVSSLKLRAGMGQSCWSIEQFMSQINSVCETCWKLQCPTHRQLRGVFASNCGPRREKSNPYNKLLADSGEKCVSLKQKLIKFEATTILCVTEKARGNSLTEHEVHSSNGNMETFWIQNTFYCFELGRLAS